MILSMSEQARLFLISVVLGFIFGFGYDWIRVFRRIIKHLGFLVQAEDILYWLFACGILFFVMLKENYGEIRAYLIIGTFIGMILYFNTLSGLFLNISMAVVGFIKRIIILFFNIITAPFKMMFKILIIPCKFFTNVLKNTQKNLKNLLKKNPIYAKIINYRNSIHKKNKSSG